MDAIQPSLNQGRATLCNRRLSWCEDTVLESVPIKESSNVATAEFLCNNLVRSLSLQAWKKIEETKKKAVEIM